MADKPQTAAPPTLADALDKLAHAARALRLSSSAQARRAQLTQDILRALKPCFRNRPRLILQVQPQRLLWNHHVVYQEHDRAESLAFRLFKSGVSTFVIEDSLNAHELNIVIDALATAPELAEPRGQDVVTQLWTSPLLSVWVTERPWHALRTMTHQACNRRILFEDAADALISFEKLTQGHNPPPSIILDAAAIESQWKRIDPGNHPEGAHAQIASRFTERLRDPTTRAALSELQALLEAATQADEDVIDSADLGNLYQVLIQGLMVFDEETCLQDLYKEWRMLATKVRPERQKIMLAALKGGTSAQTLGRFLLHVSRPSAASNIGAWIPAFFARHGKHNAEDFCELFKLNLSTHALGLLSQTVWNMKGADLGLWSSLLTSLDHEIGVLMLRWLVQQGPESFATALCQHCADHPHPEVRANAIEAIPPNAPGRRLNATLVKALQDPEAHVRCASLRRLKELADPSTGIFVVERLRRPEFEPVSKAEKRQTLDTLLAIGGERYINLFFNRLDTIAAQLQRPQSHNVDNIQQTGEAILEAIPDMGTSGLVIRLKTWLETAPKSLQHSARAALKKLTQEQYLPPSRPRRPLGNAPPKVSKAAHKAPSEELIAGLLNAYLHEDSSLHSLMQWLPPSEASDELEPSWVPSEVSEDHVDALLNDYLEATHKAVAPPEPLEAKPRVKEQETNPSPPKQGTINKLNVLSEAAWMDTLDDPALDNEVAGLIDDLMNPNSPSAEGKQ